jgi:hypothetical protein
LSHCRVRDKARGCHGLPSNWPVRDCR